MMNKIKRIGFHVLFSVQIIIVCYFDVALSAYTTTTTGQDIDGRIVTVYIDTKRLEDKIKVICSKHDEKNVLK